MVPGGMEREVTARHGSYVCGAAQLMGREMKKAGHTWAREVTGSSPLALCPQFPAANAVPHRLEPVQKSEAGGGYVAG